ncbi:Hok/Gef family protein [Atlantibacter hermannii]|nr:Hok/Gef family protein [Atlantibacter hermannii]MBL7634510.1 Hok/Gef family protein [Atlantibacter hermannii]MBL7674276.1 Hok/Gef family protein [Atlantibacter hermannii]
MKPLRYLLACLLVVCLTVLVFSLFNRGLLCKLKIRNGNQEVAARYEPFH